MRQERRAFWLGLLLALLLARSLRALLSTAFFESLQTLRLNESAGWTAALLAPALALLLGRRGLLLALGGAGLASATLSLARFTDAFLPLASFATGASLAALPLAARHPGAIAGLLTGLALDGAILAATDSHDMTLVLWGALVTLAIAAIALRLASRLAPAPVERGGMLSAIGFGALLALEIAYLANPFAVARWTSLPVWAATIAGLGGLAIGATLAPRWPLWILGALGLLDVALFLSPIRALSLAALQVALGAAGARIGARIGGRAASVVLALTFAPLVFVLLFFREPLGASEWRAIVPLLAIAALLPALRLARPARLRSPAIALALVALTVASAIPTPLAETREGRELTVVTWNIHQAFGNGGGLHPEIYEDILRRIDPDLVFLQEADTARLSSGGIDIVRYLADALHLRAIYGNGGPAILSRYPLAEDAATRSDEWFLETAVTIDGTKVWVESIHFGRSSGGRAGQAQEVIERPGSPRIVAGDTNLFLGGRIRANDTTSAAQEPDRPEAYFTLTSRYTDAWIATGHADRDPAGRTFRLPNPSNRIDMILLDGVEAEIVEVHNVEDTRAASDHLPVVARLRILR